MNGANQINTTRRRTEREHHILQFLRIARHWTQSATGSAQLNAQASLILLMMIDAEQRWWFLDAESLCHVTSNITRRRDVEKLLNPQTSERTARYRMFFEIVQKRVFKSELYQGRSVQL